MISRNEGLRLSLKTLTIAAPGLLNVLIISALFILIFGIIGVNYFKGSYYSCSVNHLGGIHYILNNPPIVTKWDCLSIGGEWLNYNESFDNIGMAVRALFVTTTTVGWAELMYNGIASLGPNLQPVNMSSPFLSFYFIAFVIVGSFFMNNLYVGVIISTYNREKEASGKNFMLTSN